MGRFDSWSRFRSSGAIRSGTALHQGASRGEEVLHLFKRGAEFTKELLEDNERLRMELVRFHEEQQYAARTPEDWDKLRQELTGRLKNLEAEYETVRERLAYVESENRAFANRYLDIEEENNNLANLYVASHQLHSTLDLAAISTSRSCASRS